MSLKLKIKAVDKDVNFIIWTATSPPHTQVTLQCDMFTLNVL